MVRVSILIGSLLALVVGSAQAATRSTVLEARIVVVDSCAAAVRPSGPQVICNQGTPYRVDRAPVETAPRIQAQAAQARTVVVTY